MRIDDGTLCLWASQIPGIVQGVRRQVSEIARRVANVRTAILEGVRDHAYDETVAMLGEDLEAILEGLWPAFEDVVKIYAAGIGAGAAIGGAAGAFAGGVGAVPGAVAGAKVGADLASALLLFLGLKFLLEYVLEHLETATGHFQRGYTLAWQAEGSTPPSQASMEFAKGTAVLCSLVVEAAGAYVIKHGLTRGMAKLSETRMGRSLSPYAEVQFWRNILGVTDAPVPRKGIRTSLNFVKKHFRIAKDRDVLGRIDGADYSKPITVLKSTDPGAPKEFVAYRLFKIDKQGNVQPVGLKDVSKNILKDSPKDLATKIKLEKPEWSVSEKESFHGEFYTDVGNYVDRLGIDRMAKAKLSEHVLGEETYFKAWVRYRVKGKYDALKSYTRGVRDHYTNLPVPGGATQYVIPKSWEALEIVDTGARSTGGGAALPKPNISPVKTGGGK